MEIKVCVPTMGKRGLDEQVGEHFGRVPTYTIVDIETNTIEIIENTSSHMSGSGYPPELIKQADTAIMLCGGLGRRAISMFEQLGIMVYVGARGTVKNTLQMYKKGQLQAATDENACRQHAFRGKGFGEGHNHHDH